MATPVLTREPVRYVTEDQFLSSDEWDGYELVDGVPVEVDMGGLSAWVGTQVSRRLANYLDDAPVGGAVFAQDTPFKAWPDRPDHFRKPDAMYFGPGRFPGDVPPEGPIITAPDIAVEVASPNDNLRTLNLKIAEYFRAGVRLIWLVDPETRTIQILRANGQDARVGPDDTLTGEDVLTGFEVRVGDLFPKRAD